MRGWLESTSKAAEPGTYLITIDHNGERIVTRVESAPTPAADVTDEEIACVAEEMGADDPGGDFWQEFARKILALRPAPVAATGKADERDAARYRWLRGHYEPPRDGMYEWDAMDRAMAEGGEDLDAAIDAAMQATWKADERAWQAIETAPSDVEVLLFSPWRHEANPQRIECRVYHDSNGLPTYADCRYWMPLPAPPETTPPTQPKGEEA